jgi:hypothetical protein
MVPMMVPSLVIAAWIVMRFMRCKTPRTLKTVSAKAPGVLMSKGGKG